MQASILISRLPQIKELDINPLLAGPNGIAAVDARVRVGRADRAGPAPRPDKGEQKT
jgi:acetyltransferase